MTLRTFHMDASATCGRGAVVEDRGRGGGALRFRVAFILASLLPVLLPAASGQEASPDASPRQAEPESPDPRHGAFEWSREGAGLVAQYNGTSTYTARDGCGYLRALRGVRAVLGLAKGGLRGESLKQVNFRGVDLRGVHFVQVNFLDTDLAGANLSGADLREAVFRRTDLTGATLAGALLRGAWYDAETRWPAGLDPQAHGARPLAPEAAMRGADIPMAQLAGLDLRRADLSRVNLSCAHFKRSDLREANLEGAFLFGADLQGARLQGARLQGALCDSLTRWPSLTWTAERLREEGVRLIGPGSDLKGARLFRAHLHGDLSGSNLEGADLRYADFGDSHKGANLRRANLRGARLATWLDRADMRGANLATVNLCGQDFRKVRLEGARLNRAYYNRWTRWPRGFRPAAHGAEYVR